ncbi:ribosome biogenesis GTPase Der [Hydrogenovibrio halophilus]|uniref:ribosome biogenesis GTPase Der n=1 Tax=Hydrogenovibrio halophilus TaxID=373391 RepID=UPI00036FCB54|nr:ribosome biogenesis GTPase Der [Hydrogenovibrio halophilus]
MKKPIIALVGRPNVGKSTLFNRLTRTRDAIVADYPGLTRDRQYGRGRYGDDPFIVVDTGGLSGEQAGVDPLMASQAVQAIKEADAVLFLVDARTGLIPADETIAQQLREFGKPVTLVVNKAEGQNPDLVGSEFYALGLGMPFAISSAHGDRVNDLLETALASIEQASQALETTESDSEMSLDEQPGTRVAIVGRPNVGKSTLINRMIGEERVVAFDLPGTTRDSIFVPFERDGQAYTLIDTAGIRRRKNIKEKIEKFSIVKAIEAMESSHVVILVMDGSEGVTDQDLTLLGLAIESGRGLILAINKWDHLSHEQRQKVKHELSHRFSFVDYAERHLISALHGTGVGTLFKTVNAVYQASVQSVSTADLNRVLTQAVADHQPPLVGGRRIKCRYAHLGGVNPPTVIIHGNQVDKLPAAYTKYLMNVFRKAFKWVGTPVRIEYRVSSNPYKDRASNFVQRRGKSLAQAENNELKRHKKQRKRTQKPRR